MKTTLCALIFALIGAAGTARAQVPAADYFSTTSRLNGIALPAGTHIEAFDSDGVRCGYAEANADGNFLMHVYGNDPMTPGIDEGAREGEFLTWKIDGKVADSTWMSNLIGMFADLRFESNAAKEIKLEARTTAIQESRWSDVKSGYRP